MSRTLLLVGTRKGLFVLESDADRREWSTRGPYCEGWPVYHAVMEPGSGTIFAAAASEWHGSAVWRSKDLGETWTLSSEGIAYDDGRKLSKISSVAAAHGRVLVGVEAPGIFESRDDGETWSLLSTLAGQPGSEGWDDPANQPPGHLGISALTFDRDDPDRFWAIVQGIGLFETADNAASWTPRNRGLRADWPREHEDVGFCVHKVARTPVDDKRLYQQNHVGMHRSDDGGHTWTEITDGLPTELRLRRRRASTRSRHVLRHPARPGPRPHDADGAAAVWRTNDAGSTWQRRGDGLPQQNAHVGVLREGMSNDTYDVARLLLRHEHRPALREHR